MNYTTCLLSILFLFLNTTSCLKKDDTAKLAGHSAKEKESSVILQNIHVIDVITQKLIPSQDVVIEKDKIISVSPTNSRKFRKGARVLNKTDMFLIPGLWDMHAHNWMVDVSVPLSIVNGITGHRDMATPLDKLKDHYVYKGQKLRPFLSAAGQLIGGAMSFWHGNVLKAIDPKMPNGEFVKLLNDKNHFGDFYKVYSLLDRKKFFAVAEHSKKTGKPFAGHVPIVIRASEAAKAGMKSMEHLHNVVLGVSKDEDRLMKKWLSQNPPVNANFLQTANAWMTGSELLTIESYDKNKAEALYKLFRDNGVYQVPTLFITQMVPFIYDESVRDVKKRPFLGKYTPPLYQKTWAGSRATPPELKTMRENTVKYHRFIVREMHKNGVKLLAGSDSAAAYSVSGFSLHEELMLMKKIGIPDADVLKIATYNPAEYFGITSQYGSIAAGKHASLVILKENPLQNIEATQSIDTVILNGTILESRDLTAIKDDVAQRVKRKDYNPTPFEFVPPWMKAPPADAKKKN